MFFVRSHRGSDRMVPIHYFPSAIIFVAIRYMICRNLRPTRQIFYQMSMASYYSWRQGLLRRRRTWTIAESLLESLCHSIIAHFDSGRCIWVIRQQTSLHLITSTYPHVSPTITLLNLQLQSWTSLETILLFFHIPHLPPSYLFNLHLSRVTPLNSTLT